MTTTTTACPICMRMYCDHTPMQVERHKELRAARPRLVQVLAHGTETYAQAEELLDALEMLARDVLREPSWSRAAAYRTLLHRAGVCDEKCSLCSVEAK